MGKKSLLNEKDIRDTNKLSKQDSGRYVKFNDGKTPFFIISPVYHDGFVHWVQLPNGDNKKVACYPEPDPSNSKASAGYNPKMCPVCAVIQEQAKEWRALEMSGRNRASKELKERNRRLSSKYEMSLLVAVGEMVYSHGSGNSRKMSIDMSEPTVGILNLTRRQKDRLLGLCGSPQYPYMNDYRDLFNRVILAKKEKVTVDWSDTPVDDLTFIPAKKPSNAPEVEYDTEEYDVSTDFEFDLENSKKIMALYTGVLDEDDEIEYESEDDDFDEDSFDEDDDTFDSDEDEDTEADDESDVDGFEFDEEENDSEDEDFDFAEEGEESEPEVTDEEDTGFDDSFLDDVDEFEDDLPWETEEEKPVIPEVKKKSSPSQSSRKKPSTKSKSLQSDTVRRSPKKAESKKSMSQNSGKKRSLDATDSSTTLKQSPKSTKKKASTGTKASSKKGTGKKKRVPDKVDF